MNVEEIANIINGKYITALGVISSIASLIISVFVLLTVKKIKRFYAFTARAPEINQKLIEIASAISDNLNSFNGFTTGLYTLLGDAEVNLKSISRKTDGPLKKKINLLIKLISSIDSRPNWSTRILGFFKNTNNDIDSQKDILQNIYVSLYKITAECTEIYEDSRWER